MTLRTLTTLLDDVKQTVRNWGLDTEFDLEVSENTVLLTFKDESVAFELRQSDWLSMQSTFDKDFTNNPLKFVFEL